MSCYLLTQDCCHDNNELKTIWLFCFFSCFCPCNFSGFLRWKCFKICTDEDIDLNLSIPYFLKIRWSNLFLMLQNNFFLNLKKFVQLNFLKNNRIGKVYTLSSTVQTFKKIQGNERYLCSFLGIFTHVTSYVFRFIN